MSLLKKISILILNFILLFILSCNNTKSDIKDKKKKSKTEKKIDVKSLSSRFSKADESDKEDILDELSDASNPDGVMIIIQGLLDKDKEVREKAINVLESYRRFTLKDLDINYYEYIDNWFRQYQLIILQQMGYEKEYTKFINDLEASGYNTRYYKKDPFHYLFRKGEISKIINASQKEYKAIVNFWTCWIIGERKYEFAIPYLIRIIKNSKAENIFNERCAAIWALSKFRNKKWDSLLIDSIEDKNPYVKELVATVIGKFKDTRVSKLFVDMVFSDKKLSFQLKIGLIWALSNMMEPGVIQLIIEKKFQDDYPWVKIHKIWAMHRFGIRSAPDNLVKSLSDKNNFVRKVAILVVYKMNDTSVVDKIITLLKDKYYKVRFFAVKILGDWKVKKAVSKMALLLTDTNKEVQDECIVALGKTGSHEAIKPLLKLLNEDRSNDQKILVVNSLMEIGNSNALDKLIDFYEKIKQTKGSKGTEFPTLSDVLIRLANKNKILELTKSSSEKVKISAIKSIPHFKKEIKDFKFLTNLMKDESINIKIEIIRVIGDLEYKDAFSLLLKIISLDKVDLKLRRESIIAIGKLKNPKGVKHLIKNIKNDEKDIRLSVIEALGYMGSERAISVLKEAYKTSKSTNEKVLIIFSLSLSNKITSKHIEFLVNKAKKPSNKLITFVKDYLNKISLLNKEKFIKSVLSRTTKAQKTILKKFLDLLSKK